MTGIDEVKRKFFGTLYNTYSFFALYANIDNFHFSEKIISHDEKPELDRWIISELNSLIKKVDSHYNNYEPTKAARLINSFVIDNLSNWYVRLSRRRFWKGEYQADKISAYQTLHTVLTDVCRVSAPLAPFFMERLFLDLTKRTKIGKNYLSVHFEDFPVSDNNKIDHDLEKKVSYAQVISSLTLSLRAKEKIKVRQPLNKILIPVSNEKEKQLILSVSQEIKNEVNVKKIEFIEGESNMIVKSIKPNFKKLGPKFGKSMNLVVEATNKIEIDEINKLQKNGSIDLLIDKKTITFFLDDFEITTKDIEGWLVANEGDITVALDILINDDLRLEGIAREIVSKIQNLRKTKYFEVTDRINTVISCDQDTEDAIKRNLDYVKTETLSNSINFDKIDYDANEIQFENKVIKIFINKI